jgi:hypothetical protein
MEAIGIKEWAAEILRSFFVHDFFPYSSVSLPNLVTVWSYLPGNIKNKQKLN